ASGAAAAPGRWASRRIWRSRCTSDGGAPGPAAPEPATPSADLLEVLLGAFRVGLHAVLARAPVGRAHLAVLVGELHGLDDAQRLVHRPPDGQIVDGDLPDPGARVAPQADSAPR